MKDLYLHPAHTLYLSYLLLGRKSVKQSESSAWAVPRAEGVTFASGSGGMRMEKGRGAAAAGQLPYLIAGRLSDPSHGGHLPGNSRTREPVFGHQHPRLRRMSAPSTLCLHGTGGRESCRDGDLLTLPVFRATVRRSSDYRCRARTASQLSLRADE
jgi:hypothetical protein